MSDQFAESASDPIDPTETSADAFLAEHGVFIDWGGQIYACKCGLAFDSSEPLSTHLFEASRSIMYRESAALLQAERANVEEDYKGGLGYAFGFMLARADAAELPEVPEVPEAGQ